jgi:hypothetical protein
MGISKFQPQQWRQKHSEEGARKEVSRASFFTVGTMVVVFMFHFNLWVKYVFIKYLKNFVFSSYKIFYQIFIPQIFSMKIFGRCF